jgi:TonB family protein
MFGFTPQRAFMRYVFAIASLLILTCLPGEAQGLTPPVLLPQTVAVSTPKHCDQLNGLVKFAATIDANGFPRALKTLEASDWRLIAFATELVQAQRFKPGVIDGLAADVAVELTVGLRTCAQREKHPTNDNFYRLTLSAHPLIALEVTAASAAQEATSATPTEPAPAEEVGEHISAPIPIDITDPKIPVFGKLPKRGQCLLGFTVDANGVPQDIHVVRELEAELDSNAKEAVKNWRFKPALRDGNTPVAFEGTVVANFEYVEREPVAFAFFIPGPPEKVRTASAHEKKQVETLEAINADEVIARYMPQSRIAGRVLVSLVIDTSGVPQNVHIVKSLDSGVDVDTVAMVEHLRFKPVMKDATKPMAVGIVVPVRFRTTVARPTWRDIFVDIMGFGILALM